MKHFIQMGFLSLVFGLTACQEKATRFQSVGANEFATVISQDDIQLVDVRTAEEYADGHIAKSVNIDVKGDGFAAEIEKRLDKSKEVAVYCRSGRRSKKAAEILEKAGFKVVELDGGFNEWKSSNHEIAR